MSTKPQQINFDDILAGMGFYVSGGELYSLGNSANPMSQIHHQSQLQPQQQQYLQPPPPPQRQLNPRQIAQILVQQMRNKQKKPQNMQGVTMPKLINQPGRGLHDVVIKPN